MKKARVWGLLILASILIGWPLLQLIGAKDAKQDPVEMLRLLHQVSSFQVELLHNQLQDAVHAATPEELNMLNQSAYSVNYTHQRFALAAGASSVTSLASVEAMLQYIMHLQIAGKKELERQDEVLLKEAGAHFTDLLHAYKQLISSNGKVVRSKNDEVARFDQKIQELIRDRLLE